MFARRISVSAGPGPGFPTKRRRKWERTEGLREGWIVKGASKGRKNEREIYRVTTGTPGGYCFPISRALCMSVRLKPSYTQEDSRVTAPAGP